jgi:hypothetical protein
MKHLRIIENFHLVLWLLKDTCWMLEFKIGGVIMIIPTIALAIFISYRTRYNPALLWPNLSVCCWIGANGYWMLGEFFDFNHVPVSLFLFVAGLICISLYLLKYRNHSHD